MNTQQKFTTVRGELLAGLLEREVEVDISLVSLLCRQHVLLVGPPGTAKSMLADAITRFVDGTRFNVLLSKYSVTEELFGPINVAGLKSGVYERITTGMLPEANVAFIDEIFKASSAILNTMLGVLNERKFRNGAVNHVCPLELAYGCSNEWGSAKELGALFDRFLFRREVRPVVRAESFQRLLWDADLTPQISVSVTPAELVVARTEAGQLPWADDAKAALLKIFQNIRQEGIIPGDRRCRAAPAVASATAWITGATQVEPEHLDLLSHVLWTDHEEHPRKLAEIVGTIANPTGLAVNGLLIEADQIISGTNLKDLSSAASSTAKLGNIRDKLRGLSGTRADEAMKYVEASVKRMRAAAVEAF